MVRAGAKNWKSVAVLTSPDQYPDLLRELDENGGALSDPFRLSCAQRAFALTARYDAAITSFLENNGDQ